MAFTIETTLTATEANSLAKTALANQKIAEVTQLQTATGIGSLAGSLYSNKSLGAVGPAQATSSAAIQKLKELDSSLNYTADPILQQQVTTKLQTEIESLYWSQLQAIRTTANNGQFELIFDLTEQAKIDLSDFLKGKGYKLNEVPVSSVSRTASLSGSGKLKGTVTADYQGRSVAYYSFGQGSLIVLVQWK